jgi:anaerobic magnesium-protoporphyrin IX monomethyl ester cyclase
VRIHLHLIFGLPRDTFEGFCAGAGFALDLQPKCVIFNRLSVLRGTPLRRDAAKYGLRYNPNPPYSVRECNTFPSGDIDRACQLRDSISRVFFPHIRYLD